MSEIINKIREELIQNADEKTKSSGERFFKEEIKLYGLKSADVSRISKEHYKDISDKSKSHIFSLCYELWKYGYMEESFVACKWAYNMHKQFEPSDFDVFEE